MVLVTTEFSYLFLDIHLQNAFSAFGVQFISSFQLAQRTGGALCCPERCEQNFRCTLLHFCPVQSFPSPNTLRGKVVFFFSTNPVSSDPNCGWFISIFISAVLDYLNTCVEVQEARCRGSCSCQRTVGKTDFGVQGLIKDESLRKYPYQLYSTGL